MSNVKVTVNNVTVEVPKDATILTAVREAGFNTPTLCYHQDLAPTSACGVCVVEIEGAPVPKRACSTPVTDGMKVTTNSHNLRVLRKTLVELILANHDVQCPTCVATGKCELQALAFTMGIDPEAVPSMLVKRPIDRTSVSIIRNTNKCINCGRCIYVCNELQTVNALTFAERGFSGHVDTAMSLGMGKSACVNCGQCTVFCPTAALTEKDDTDRVWEAILDPTKHVVVQEAPSIRASLGEEWGMGVGAITIGKMYAALKRIGFDAIVDTNFSADLTILEEGTEVVGRIVNGGKLPVITSCSPGWVKFMETYFPDLACNVSTAKSPQQMMGVLVKTYYAKEKGIDPANIVSVSIMPCTAKKFECQRPEMHGSGFQDVDYVLTTREIVRMIKEAGIDFVNLPEAEEPVLELSENTGAATIFGATGGVMEAALRSAYYLVTGTDLKDVEITPVRGMQGIKEASVPINTDLTLKVAVAHGLGNARKLMEKVRQQIQETGKSEYHFIEVMACPGGCVGGGGQPFGSSFAMRARRGLSLYKDDRDHPKRCSHHNPMIHKIYEKFLEKPGSHLAHKLLHTHYFEREQFHGQVVKEAECEHH
jgi:NADH-quinone oxidoreductase subunit G